MAKLDPRADVLSTPPSQDFSVDRVAVPKSKRSAEKTAADEPPAEAAAESSVVPIGEAAQPKPDEAVAKAATKITSQDPRYEPLEKLLDLNDWKKIGAELGSLDDVGKLPPNLGLVAALAHNENAKEGDPAAAAIAIRCMAGLLGVSDDSPIARVLARRMLRKNPVKLRDRRAPPAKTSLLIVLLTLVLGGGVGWLASIGSWSGIARMLHLS
jgi:hypothetical protein